MSESNNQSCTATGGSSGDSAVDTAETPTSVGVEVAATLTSSIVAATSQQQNSSKSKKNNVLNSSVNLYTFVKLWNHTVKLVMSRKPLMFDGVRVASDVDFFRQCVRKYKLHINQSNDLPAATMLVDDVHAGLKRSISDSENCAQIDSGSLKRVRRDESEFDKLAGVASVDDDVDDTMSTTIGGVTISEVIDESEPQKPSVLNFTEIPETVYLEVFNLLFVALEFEGLTYTFSREYLRYFLASYSKIINLSDFKNTNRLNKPTTFDDKPATSSSTAAAAAALSKHSGEKNSTKSSSRSNHQDSAGSGDECKPGERSSRIPTTAANTVAASASGSQQQQQQQSSSSNSRKNKNISSAGGILLEYYKTPNNFKLLLTKCEHSDADALKYVVNLKLKLPSSIYRERGSSVHDKFETLTDCSSRAGFVKTAVSSGKTHVLCVTKHAIMVWDKHMYTLPPVSLEKELPLTATYGIFNDASNESAKYVLYVLLNSNKLTLVDVVSVDRGPLNTTDLMNLPFARRCSEMVNQLNGFAASHDRPLPWNCAEIEPDTFADSCLFIPQTLSSVGSPCTRYAFTKPEHIVAVFGMEKQNVLVAYARNDKDFEFEYKLKIPISGPASFTILTESVRFMEASEETEGVIVEDRATDAECRIFDVPYSADSLIFEKIIPVQLLNSKQLEMPMFHRQVTRASEYRLPLAREPVSSKPQSFEKMLAKHLLDNANNLHKMIQTINLQLSDDQKEEIKNGLVISEKITEIKMNFK